MDVLFIAGWYPYKNHEHFAVFIKEHARSIAKYAQLHIVHLKVEKSFKYLPWKIDIDLKYPEQNITEYEVKLYLPLRRFGLHDFLVKRAFNETIELIRNKHDIGLLHLNVRMHLTECIAQLKSCKDLPIVYTEHYTFYHTGIDNLPEAQKKQGIEGMKSWLALPQLKSIMPVSNELADVFIQKYDADPRRIKVVPNIAHPAFHYKAGNLPEDKITIVLAALWAGNKHPILLVESIEKLSEELQAKIRIDWIGDGKYLPQVKRFVKDKLKKTEVVFHGFQSKEFIAEKLHDAHFLAHPTKAENLPCIIIESLCSGVPVLSNAVNGVPELIDYNNGLLAKPEDLDDYTEKLQTMLEKWKRFDRKAIASEAHSKFSEEVVGSEIFEAYQKYMKE